MKQLISYASRVIFIFSFILAGLAVWERLSNMFGYTLLRIYSPGRLLEFSAVALLFVIALQLRELKSLIEQNAER